MLVTRSIRGRIAIVTIAALAASPITPLFATQTPAPAQAPAPTPTPTTQPAAAKPATKTPAAKPAAAPAAAPVPTDGDWPRSRTTASGALLVVYQPQIASWTDQHHAVAYAAVSHTPKGAPKPALGTIKLESDTSVAIDERLVSFTNLKITEPSFPTLERDQLRTAVEEIIASVVSNDKVIALDRVLANIDTSQIIPKNVEAVKADPPQILFSKTPAILVNIDGEPDLGADPAERSVVRRQHQLGSVPAHPDQDLLSPQRPRLVESHRREGAVGTGRDAAGKLQETARG